MRAGQLKTRMTWRHITTSNNAGDVTTAYEDKQIQVSVLSNSGKKGENNHETFTAGTIRFVMRNHYAVEEDDEVIYKDNEYGIDNLDDTTKPGWLFVTMSKKNS